MLQVVSIYNLFQLFNIFVQWNNQTVTIFLNTRNIIVHTLLIRAVHYEVRLLLVILNVLLLLRLVMWCKLYLLLNTLKFQEQYMLDYFSYIWGYILVKIICQEMLLIYFHTICCIARSELFIHQWSWMFLLLIFNVFKLILILLRYII